MEEEGERKGRRMKNLDIPLRTNGEWKSTLEILGERNNHYWLRADKRSPYRYRGGVWVACHHQLFFVYVVAATPTSTFVLFTSPT